MDKIKGIEKLGLLFPNISKEERASMMALPDYEPSVGDYVSLDRHKILEHEKTATTRSCLCGGTQHVLSSVNGVIESTTCPRCGRYYRNGKRR